MTTTTIDLAIDTLTAKWNLRQGEARLMIEDVERAGFLRVERGEPCPAAAAQAEQTARIWIGEGIWPADARRMAADLGRAGLLRAGSEAAATPPHAEGVDVA